MLVNKVRFSIVNKLFPFVFLSFVFRASAGHNNYYFSFNLQLHLTLVARAVADAASATAAGFCKNHFHKRGSGSTGSSSSNH